MLLRAVQRSFPRPLASALSPFLAARIPSRLVVVRGLAASALFRSLTPTTPTTPTTTLHSPAPPETSQTDLLQVQPDPAPTPLQQQQQPPPPPLHESLALLAALKAQPSQYITIHIHKFPFLVTVGDLVRLPFRLKDVNVGDTLRITHASVLGSRDYTLKGNPYIDERLFECRAVVVEETSEPLRKKEKTKRRQRRIKTVKSKHRYTVLRIRELVIHDRPQDVAAGAGEERELGV